MQISPCVISPIAWDERQNANLQRSTMVGLISLFNLKVKACLRFYLIGPDCKAFWTSPDCSWVWRLLNPVAVAAEGSLPAYLMSSALPRLKAFIAVAKRGATYPNDPIFIGSSWHHTTSASAMCATIKFSTLAHEISKLSQRLHSSLLCRMLWKHDNVRSSRLQ